jgi:Zn-dependent protease
VSLSPDQIRWIFIDIFVLVVSVAFHEFGHAIMADRLGDDLPRRQGRVTLNPIAHIDPIGTLLLPLAGGVYAAHGGIGGGFGWGKPVQTITRNYTRRISMNLGHILVSFAGPAMNIVLALLLTGIRKILDWQGVLATGGEISKIFAFAVATNFILFFFNLIPCPPLDGGHIAGNLVPYRHREKWDQYARFGWVGVICIAMIPQLAQIFIWPAMFCAEHLYGLFGLTWG